LPIDGAALDIISAYKPALSASFCAICGAAERREDVLKSIKESLKFKQRALKNEAAEDARAATAPGRSRRPFNVVRASERDTTARPGSAPARNESRRLAEMADAGPRQMVDQRAQLFVRQERHGLDAGLEAELAIGIEKVLHPRISDDRKVMDDVTDQEQRRRPLRS
jgi:hypothetical protein